MSLAIHLALSGFEIIQLPVPYPYLFSHKHCSSTTLCSHATFYLCFTLLPPSFCSWEAIHPHGIRCTSASAGVQPKRHHVGVVYCRLISLPEYKPPRKGFQNTNLLAMGNSVLGLRACFVLPRLKRGKIHAFQ